MAAVARVRDVLETSSHRLTATQSCRHELKTSPRVSRDRIETFHVNAPSYVGTARIIQCPFSVAQEYAEDFFAAAVRDAECPLPSQKLVPSLTGRLCATVRVIFNNHFDAFERGRRHSPLAVTWTGESALFEDFRGTLQLRIASTSTTDAALEGSYRARYGIFGRLFNRALGHRLAQTILEELMNQLASTLERREARYRASFEGSRFREQPILEGLATVWPQSGNL